MIGPEQDDAFHFLPKLRPVRATEVQWINVLVFFGRILGVLDGSIRPLVKPLRMFVHIGMVGRTIDRKIERDLHAALANLVLKPIEIFNCTKV